MLKVLLAVLTLSIGAIVANTERSRQNSRVPALFVPDAAQIKTEGDSTFDCEVTFRDVSDAANGNELYTFEILTTEPVDAPPEELCLAYSTPDGYEDGGYKGKVAQYEQVDPCLYEIETVLSKSFEI